MTAQSPKSKVQCSESLRAPFPYFGGKRKVAAEVWKRFGSVDNYIEPFFGSGAVLLQRPTPFSGLETVNDADGLLANFWRALQMAPGEVARFADWPVNENDLHARHAWLVSRKDDLQGRLEGDPEFFDAKIAGWWVWGISCWIGGGFCSGKGPWRVQEIDGVRQLVHCGDNGQGVNRQLVHCGDNGQGVNRQLVHCGGNGCGVNRKRQRLTGVAETGVNAVGTERKRPVMAGPSGGKSVLPSNDELLDYFNALATRLRRVRVCCGDWSRITGPSVTHKNGVTGVFLDPPYSESAGRDSDLYRVDCERVALEVRKYAIENGENPMLRIALCGYEDEHVMPENWTVYSWNAGAGFGGQAKEQTGNGARERIWFSPHCLNPEPELF